MYFSEPVVLLSESVASDQFGNQFIERDDGTLVWANVYTIGTSTWLAARSAGLHADADLQVRSVDYNGQNIAVVKDVEYSIERASDSGEFTRLTLARRLSND